MINYCDRQVLMRDVVVKFGPNQTKLAAKIVS
jgi:hypothetical protein